MSILAMTLATVLGTCSLNNQPAERCVMVYEITADRMVAVGWRTSSEGSIVFGGPQVSTTRMNIEAVKFNEAAAQPLQGYCIVSTTITCHFSIGNKAHVFTYVED